jgi:hypothetical protein
MVVELEITQLTKGNNIVISLFLRCAAAACEQYQNVFA